MKTPTVPALGMFVCLGSFLTMIYVVVFVFLSSIHTLKATVQSDPSVCSEKSCQIAGQSGANNKLSASEVRTAPCWEKQKGMVVCFGYGADGKCPWPSLTDCLSTPATTPATTPITEAPSTDSKISTSPSAWPYIVGGAVALIAIGVIVFMLVNKSSRNDDEYEEDVLEFTKPVPLLPNMDQFNPDSRQEYHTPFNNGMVDPNKASFSPVKPQKQGMVSVHVARQIPSSLNQKNASLIAQANSDALPASNCNSFFEPTMTPQWQQTNMVAEPQISQIKSGDGPAKEQFYVPKVEEESSFGSLEISRKSSFEF
jgi:hypothetical protein